MIIVQARGLRHLWSGCHQLHPKGSSCSEVGAEAEAGISKPGGTSGCWSNQVRFAPTGCRPPELGRQVAEERQATTSRWRDLQWAQITDALSSGVGKQVQHILHRLVERDVP